MSNIPGAEDELEPPWACYPQIPNGSIGWRMGYGEGYQIQWSEFADARCKTVEDAVRYLKGHPPAPRTWTEWIAGWLAGIEDTDETAMIALVQREGLIADDAAYPVFVRNSERHGGVVAPWEARAVDPETALRYDARELGWWARWFAGEPDRASWLASRPRCPDSWAAIVGDIAAGRCDASWSSLDGGARRLIPLMAMHGELTPPWLGGHPPKANIDWDDASADDRDRWSWWAFETFEDAATWNAYATRHAAPPAWRNPLEL